MFQYVFEKNSFVVYDTIFLLDPTCGVSSIYNFSKFTNNFWDFKHHKNTPTNDCGCCELDSGASWINSGDHDYCKRRDWRDNKRFKS